MEAGSHQSPKFQRTTSKLFKFNLIPEKAEISRCFCACIQGRQQKQALKYSYDCEIGKGAAKLSVSTIAVKLICELS